MGEPALNELAAEILLTAHDRNDVQRLKIAWAARHGLQGVPRNSDILAQAGADREPLLPLLQVKPTRTLSGVAIVTVQASPAACPHGRCTFCPGGPDTGTAMSYTGHEPAARRALRHGFDPHGQVANRLAQLARNGHPVDKVDLIIQGGTFPAREPGYQDWFIQRCLDALNGADAADTSPDLAAAQARNEAAGCRCTALVIETKPDWCRREHVERMLMQGCTRVEIGVQTLWSGALDATNRGHGVAETAESFGQVLDHGMKVCAHLMPGMPGVTASEDLESARRLLQDPALAPDMLKIYPTLVIPGTPLATHYARGRYEPLTDEEAADRTARIKALVPPWVRIQRVERDIPTHQILAGPKHTNLRQMAAARGVRCRCLRCREFARAAPDAPTAEPTLTSVTYRAGGGREHFLAYEDPALDVVLAYVRVRLPGPRAPPELAQAAVVRELKVVGPEVPIGRRASGGAQHRGLGRRLMAAAERVARDAGRPELAVTAAIGTRAYYRKLGYERRAAWMVRPLG